MQCNPVRIEQKRQEYQSLKLLNTKYRVTLEDDR